ncbi:hypothetical protein Tco_0671668, partial [Tanacetum coccineum]
MTGEEEDLHEIRSTKEDIDEDGLSFSKKGVLDNISLGRIYGFAYFTDGNTSLWGCNKIFIIDKGINRYDFIDICTDLWEYWDCWFVLIWHVWLILNGYGSVRNVMGCSLQFCNKIFIIDKGNAVTNGFAVLLLRVR